MPFVPPNQQRQITKGEQLRELNVLNVLLISEYCIASGWNWHHYFLFADGDSTFGSRIESLDSTRVEDMVREYFAKADQVGLLIFLLFVYVIVAHLSGSWGVVIYCVCDYGLSTL